MRPGTGVFVVRLGWGRGGTIGCVPGARGGVCVHVRRVEKAAMFFDVGAPHGGRFAREEAGGDEEERRGRPAKEKTEPHPKG